jgi:hypothetical protein
MAGFSSSRFAFFKFARVNRKLLCSTLSGVECLPYTPCAARLKTLTPETTLRIHHHYVTPDSSGSAAKGKNSHPGLTSWQIAGYSSRETLAGRVLLGSPVTRSHHWKESRST